jgi:hypothetical protein
MCHHYDAGRWCPVHWMSLPGATWRGVLFFYLTLPPIPSATLFSCARCGAGLIPESIFSSRPRVRILVVACSSSRANLRSSSALAAAGDWSPPPRSPLPSRAAGRDRSAAGAAPASPVPGATVPFAACAPYVGAPPLPSAQADWRNPAWSAGLCECSAYADAVRAAGAGTGAGAASSSESPSVWLYSSQSASSPGESLAAEKASRYSRYCG